MLTRLSRAPEFGVGAAAILIYGVFVLASWGNGFATVTGTTSWLNTASQLGIIAVPTALLMIAGFFDLSIGSMVGAGSITVGIVAGYEQQNLWVALLAAAGVAVAVGLANGLLVTRTGLPSFIVTLGANLTIAGLSLTIAQTLTNSTSITVQTSGFVSRLLDWQWGPLSVSVFWWLGIAIVAGWILGKTRVGNWIFATGGDPERARRSGVATSRVTIVLFISTALAAAFVGAMQAVQFSTSDPTTGQGYVFEAPIVVVIGGVLISGGYGSILGVVLGTIVYGIVSAGLFYTGWNTDYAQVVIGVLMIVAVLTNNFFRKLALSAGRARGTG